MGLIGPENLEFFTLELKKKIAIFDFVYTLASTIINQSAPNLVKIYMTIRSQISVILGVIGSEQLELFALGFEKLLYFTLFNTVASTNINQLVLYLGKIYMALRSWMSLIMGVIRPEQLDLYALELESSLE